MMVLLALVAALLLAVAVGGAVALAVLSDELEAVRQGLAEARERIGDLEAHRAR